MLNNQRVPKNGTRNCRSKNAAIKYGGGWSGTSSTSSTVLRPVTWADCQVNELPGINWLWRKDETYQPRSVIHVYIYTYSISIYILYIYCIYAHYIISKHHSAISIIHNPLMPFLDKKNRDFHHQVIAFTSSRAHGRTSHGSCRETETWPRYCSSDSSARCPKKDGWKTMGKWWFNDGLMAFKWDFNGTIVAFVPTMNYYWDWCGENRWPFLPQKWLEMVSTYQL